MGVEFGPRKVNKGDDFMRSEHRNVPKEEQYIQSRIHST